MKEKFKEAVRKAFAPLLEAGMDMDQTAIETVREMKQAHTSGSGITLSYPQLHSILLHLHP